MLIEFSAFDQVLPEIYKRREYMPISLEPKIYTVSRKTAPYAWFKIFEISKLCAISIQQHEYMSIFNKSANFSENLPYRH